jgi:hypothetical protein
MRALIQVRAGAAVDHRIEIPIANDLEQVGAHGAGESPGHVKAVEGQHAAGAGLDPVDRRIVRILGHREDPGGIGLEQDVGRDVHGMPVVHRTLSRAPGPSASRYSGAGVTRRRR